MSAPFDIDFPEHLDGYEAETESKGYLLGLVVRSGELRWNLAVYDPVRLAQDVAEELKGASYFAFGGLIVVPSVTRESITSAIQEMALSDFIDLS